MKLLNWIPGAFVTKLAIIGLIYVLGITTGQLWENQRLTEREHQESADRQRENHLVFFAELKRFQQEYKNALAQQRAADTAAYAALEQRLAETAQAAERARASLRLALGEKEKLQENVDGLKNVTVMLADAARAPDPGCVYPPGVRQAIDGFTATINAAPNVGKAYSASTGLPLEPASPVALLTCRELAASVIDVLNVGAQYIARDQSWRTWADEALR